MKQFLLFLGIYLSAIVCHAQVKLYGLTSSGGANNSGIIFEWDPATNVLTKKIDLSSEMGSQPRGDLVAFDNSTIPTNLNLAPTAGSAASPTETSNVIWTASSNKGWLAPSYLTGGGTTTLTL